MNQEVLNQPVLVSDESTPADGLLSYWRSYAPFLIAIFGAVFLLLAKVAVGGW